MSDAGPERQKHLGKKIPKKLLLCGGDCNLVNDFLIARSEKSIFGFLQYLNSLLRSFGYAIQANNPVSGLIIIIAIGTANYKAMFTALITSTLAFLFAKLVRQDVLGNLNGFFSYNAVLHAVVSIAYVPTLYPSVALNEPRFWLLLLFATFISVYLTSSFANLFRYLWHYPIPCFTIPFNLLQYILIFCMLHNSIPQKILSSDFLEPPVKWNGNSSEVLTPIRNGSFVNNSSSFSLNASVLRKRNTAEDYVLDKDVEQDHKWVTNLNVEVTLTENEGVESLVNETHLNWGEAFSGTIKALSQVYGLKDIPCSVLMFLALIIYSPTTALFCYFGSLVGTIVGIFFSSNYEEVYDGTWGYNGLLCAGALGGFGYVLTAQSAFLSFVAVIFCTIFQHFITPLFQSIDVPIFHIPFIVTTVIFLLVSAEVEKALPRPGIYTYPEKHRRDFKNQFNSHMEGYLKRVRGTDEI